VGRAGGRRRAQLARLARLPRRQGHRRGLLVLKLTRNVVFTAAAGFLATIFLLPLFGRPPEAAKLLWGAVAIMVVAVLPNAIRTLTTPGALRDYLRNPMKVYEKPSESEDNHS
jgi:hypothetical protein